MTDRRVGAVAGHGGAAVGRAQALRALGRGAVLLLAMTASAAAQSLSRQDLDTLLAPRSAAAAPADGPAVASLLERLGQVARTEPMWPVYTFLRAELLQRQRQGAAAAAAYHSLVVQSAANPYHDTWGGHGLTAFALYRWLQWHAASGATDRAAFEQVATWADSVLETRLVRSAFRPYAILSSLPLLEEQLYHALATEALRVGASRRAAAYFVGYLSRARSRDLVPENDPLYRVMIEQGAATADRVALLRGKRLVAMRQSTNALPYLEMAERSEDLQTRLEAMYLRARASGSRLSREAKSALYTEVHRYATRNELAQAALLQDALQFPATEPEFAARLKRVVREYPDGAHTGEALHWLAWGARTGGDLEAARAWQSLLRRQPGQSGHYSRAATDLAMAYLWRGQPADLQTAASLLSDLVQAQPAGEKRPQALFWLGRIAEQQGRQAEARQRFEQAAAADWYGFHGLRARMHLASGAAARSQLLVQDAALRNELRAAYAVEAPTTPAPTGDAGVYQQRLRSALASGLYRQALSAEPALRAVSPSRRVQEMGFEELDASGLLAPIAVAIALRQDALAAADADPALTAPLVLARQLGEAAADWPGLLSLVHPVSVRPIERSAQLMRVAGYLRTAYPLIMAPQLRDAVRRHGVAPALLYAVMRQESFFYPAALSSSHALGLFQFIRSTFDELDREWGLLAASGAADRAAYLMDEALAIDLGARWFAQKKLPAFDGQWLPAVLAHHSGDAKVLRWTAVWQARGWSDDIEMIVDSFRMPDLVPEASDEAGIEGRTFARRVAVDLALVESLQLYIDRPAR